MRWNPTFSEMQDYSVLLVTFALLHIVSGHLKSEDMYILYQWFLTV